MTTAAVFGLGSMGFGMGQSLLRAGLTSYGFDVRADAVERFGQAGGRAGALADVAPQLDAAVLVVVNAAQAEAVLFGDGNDDVGLAARLAKGAVVINCATVPPAFARETEARLEAEGCYYLDAPISGGAVKAAAGELTIMASGTPAARQRAEPVLDAMAQTVFWLGEQAGPASAMKIVNQLLAGVHIAAAAEAITFGLSQGIPAERCVEVISQCAGTSWMFENRGPHIVDGDYTPRSMVGIFVKDLGIVSDIAREARFAAPLTATALQQFIAAAGMGLEGEDDAAVAKVYARQAGLSLPEPKS